LASRHCVDRSLLLLTIDGCDCDRGNGDDEEEPQSRTKKRRISRAERVATASALAVGGDFIMMFALCLKLKRMEDGILCAVDITYIASDLRRHLLVQAALIFSCECHMCVCALTVKYYIHANY
jgi:hypothetical protein